MSTNEKDLSLASLANLKRNNNKILRLKLLYVAGGSNRVGYTKMLESMTESLQKSAIYLIFTMLSSGLSVIERFDTEHFDIVFIDDNISDLTPAELVNILKVRGYSTPCARISSTEIPEREKAMFCGFLIKPFSLSTFIGVIIQELKKIQRKTEELAISESMSETTSCESDVTSSDFTSIDRFECLSDCDAELEALFAADDDFWNESFSNDVTTI